VVARYDVNMISKILFTAPLIVLVLFLVSSYFLSLPLGLALFFFTPSGSEVSRLPLRLPIELFMVVNFSIPVTTNAGLVFLFLLGVYALCFVGACMSRESLHRVIRKGFSRPFSQFFNNNLFAMPIITSMLFIVFIIIHVVLKVPTGPGPLEPSEDPLQPFKDFFAVTYSPLVEEIGFRISPIGIFLIAYLFAVRKETVATSSRKQLLKALCLVPLYPDKAKELLGVRTVREFGFKGISWAEWIMIVVTSVAFGLAHIGGGWEAGKSISTTINAVAFGLAYLFYGAQAPILLHWFFNYYISGYGAYALALNFYPIVSPFVLSMDLAILILGIVGWSMFTVMFGIWAYGRWKGGVARLPPPPMQLPSPTPPPPIIRFCRRCGRVLSEDMKFCPHCGQALEEKTKEDA